MLFKGPKKTKGSIAAIVINSEKLKFLLQLPGSIPSIPSVVIKIVIQSDPRRI